MRDPENELYKRAMGIVNQLFDLAEVPVKKRQEINDVATDYVKNRLLDEKTNSNYN